MPLAVLWISNCRAAVSSRGFRLSLGRAGADSSDMLLEFGEESCSPVPTSRPFSHAVSIYSSATGPSHPKKAPVLKRTRKWAPIQPGRWYSKPQREKMAGVSGSKYPAGMQYPAKRTVLYSSRSSRLARGRQHAADAFTLRRKF